MWASLWMPLTFLLSGNNSSLQKKKLQSRDTCLFKDKLDAEPKAHSQPSKFKSPPSPYAHWSARAHQRWHSRAWGHSGWALKIVAKFKAVSQCEKPVRVSMLWKAHVRNSACLAWAPNAFNTCLGDRAELMQVGVRRGGGPTVPASNFSTVLLSLPVSNLDAVTQRIKCHQIQSMWKICMYVYMCTWVYMCVYLCFGVSMSVYACKYA